MKFKIALALCVAVSGCVSEPTVEEMSYSEQLAFLEEMTLVCEGQGVRRETEQMNACLRVEISHENERRETAAEDRAAFGEALGSGLSYYGNAQQNAVASYRAPIRCSSSNLAGTINTTCY